MQFLRPPFVAAIFGVLWVIMIPKNTSNYLGSASTRVQVNITRRLVERFQKKVGHLPKNLGEIRLFALGQKISYSPYDGYATRMVYKPINHRYFSIESHGKPRKTPFAIYKGHAYHNLPPVPRNLSVADHHRKEAQVYPSYLLEGSKWPKSDWSARLFRSKSAHKMSLVVQSRKNKYGLITAPHPHVEEFFWVSKTEIIYTATLDHLFDDGIYHWDIESGRTRNLLQSFKIKSGHKGSAKQRFYLALSAMKNHKVYVYIAPNQGQSLNPSLFYSEDNLFYIDNRNPQTRAKGPFPPQGAIEGNPLADLKFRDQGKKGSPKKTVQYAWNHLSLIGKPQSVLETWQDFSIKFPDSAVLPYSLIWLTCLYHDASQGYQNSKAKESNALRIFGAEIANSLLQSPSAPAYIHAFAGYTRSTLLQNKSLDFQISDLIFEASSE